MFLPSGDRAVATDNAVRQGLAHSLQVLLGDGEALDGYAIEDLAAGAPPVFFGLYYDLLLAQQGGNEPEARAALLAAIGHYSNAIAAVPNRSDSPLIITLDDAVRNADERATLLRWFDLEPENALALASLRPEELRQAQAALRRAMDVLRTLLPEFYREFRALTRQVIFAKPGGDQKLVFGGVSSFALWGALALNSEVHPNWYDYVPRLVHEYAHNLLFGLAMREPLVLNDPSERIPSPLRGSDRPVDGVYHAAFVSAREALALTQLQAALEANAHVADREELLSFVCETVGTSFATYEACHDTLHEHARFTDLGAQILGETQAAMVNLRG